MPKEPGQQASARSFCAIARDTRCNCLSAKVSATSRLRSDENGSPEFQSTARYPLCAAIWPATSPAQACGPAASRFVPRFSGRTTRPGYSPGPPDICHSWLPCLPLWSVLSRLWLGRRNPSGRRHRPAPDLDGPISCAAAPHSYLPGHRPARDKPFPAFPGQAHPPEDARARFRSR